jgi:aspartyl-tRNA(Asn)/glutamyl-tRNA(Gln) amidotransferase subunit A
VNPSITDLAGAFARGEQRASEILDGALTRIAEQNGRLNAFTAVTAERARGRARVLDQARDQGRPLGPLAGVPFAVKNLFDVAGLATLAGSKINRDDPPAARDATLVARLEAAGAVLVGTLNMSEYAYDFTGENVHDGPARNPHDPARMSGGSSGGSGSAVAARLVPLALGSDTSGSIRVPASLCGIFGLKPTYGRLSRAGTFPLAASFDHVGPLAGCARDLALAYDALQGPDARDPICSPRPPEPVTPRLDQPRRALRVAIAGGYFDKGLFPEARAALERVAAALGADRVVELPESERARAAAFVITAGEAAQLHAERLRRRARDFDPAIRDRLLAAAMLPASVMVHAQKFRRWYRDRVLDLFRDVDVIVAPATPCSAPRIGDETLMLDGEPVSVRRNLGLLTQPISFIGFPVAVVPVPLSPLPIGVQIITRPWHEATALQLAYALEQDGVVAAPHPPPAAVQRVSGVS